MDDTQTGTCFCGAVELEVSGHPEAMGYCHCTSCRSWSASPVNAFSLWKPENVTVTRGKELIGHYQKTPASDRQFCTRCGGHLMTHHPAFGLTDVYAATIPGLGSTSASIPARSTATSRHPAFGLIDVYAATIPGLAFAPGVHVNYAETVLPIRDGLPKMKDFPSELGGSGETLPE